MKLKIDMDKLRETAETAIKGLALQKIGGQAKHKRAVKEVAKWADDQLTFGDGVVGRVAESLDGPLLKLIIGAVVKESFLKLRDLGEV
jgi:hypothetical protein